MDTPTQVLRGTVAREIQLIEACLSVLEGNLTGVDPAPLEEQLRQICEARLHIATTQHALNRHSTLVR